MKLLEGGRRLDPELLDQHPSGLLIHLESFRLAPASIQGEHELAARALAQWALAHDVLQLPDQLRSATKLELGVDPLLDGRQPQLLEPCRLVLGEAFVREVGQRLTAPELERLANEGDATLCLG